MFYANLIKNTGLFAVTNGTALSVISGKEDNLVGCTEIFGNLLLGSTVPFDVLIIFNKTLFC